MYGFTLEKCRKRGVLTLEKCRNCSAPGVEGRGGEVKNDNIALVYQHKKTPTPQRLRESFYLKSVRYHCSECGELAVRQFHVGAGFYVLVILVVEECGVVYCYAFQTTVVWQSVGADGSFATAAHHVADMYVAPFRHAFSVLWNCDLAVVLFHAVFLVGISAFKDYRLVLDVSHHDVAHVDVLRLSASADAALEAQSGISA